MVGRNPFLFLFIRDSGPPLPPCSDVSRGTGRQKEVRSLAETLEKVRSFPLNASVGVLKMNALKLEVKEGIFFF